MVVVTVGGPPGSGTTTLCKLLTEKTGYGYVYAGQIFREKAKELGLSLAEFSALCEREPRYDIELDRAMLSLVERKDIILEGRMIGPLCGKEGRKAYKIYIDADPEVRARRVMERDGGDLSEVMKAMERRESSEALRYLNYYGIDPRERKHYDLWLDSTGITPEKELEIVLSGLEGFMKRLDR